MIVYGGFLKGKAVLFAVMGIVFIVMGIVIGGFVQTTFIIIGIADLVAAGLSYWMGKQTEPKDPGMGQGGTWVG
jgi:hypothetical protein